MMMLVCFLDNNYNTYETGPSRTAPSGHSADLG